MIKVNFKKKEDLYPKFGEAFQAARVINVREDLPDKMLEFVMTHEMYHVDDPVKNWFLREVRANWHAAKQHKWGFCLTCLWSFAPYRLWFYVQRIIKGE